MPDATRREVLSALGGIGLASVASPAVTATSRTSSPHGHCTTGSVLPPPAELETIVDEVMSARVGEQTPGLTVAIVEGDDVALAKGYGKADTATGEPVRADETAFEIGSVSKLVTWTAVMQGVEDGRLDLDVGVNAYLEDSRVQVPEAYDEPVTLGHLGTHTAGFESVIPDFRTDPADLTTLETALVEKRPNRVRPPGTAVEYSNYGTVLAGHVVAESAGIDFDSYVESEIGEPLGMEYATFRQPVPDTHPGVLATPHGKRDGTFVPTERAYVNARPAGSMTATATDMAAFMRAHLRGGALDGSRILDETTVRDMHGQHYVRHPAVNNWRYGFYEYGPVGAGTIAHSGGTRDFVSELVLVPERDVGIFVSYNRSPVGNVVAADVDELLREFDLMSEPGTPTSTNQPGGERRTETVAGEYRSPTFAYASGPGQALGALQRVTVESAESGRLATRSLAPQLAVDGKTWIETEPYVYAEADGSDVLAFDVTDGSVQAMHVSSLPQAVFRPVGFHESQLVTGAVVGGALTGFALSLVGWGGAKTWQAATHLVDSNGQSADRDEVSPDGDGTCSGQVKNP